MRNEQERLAREWAESKLAMPTGHLDADVIAAANHILATTKEPTMADVEWDDEKHRLAGATTINGDSVAMLWHDDIDTDHIITDSGEYSRNYLTPNGKRYNLVEVTVSSGENVAPDQPDHPEFLETVEDYKNAPQGTIVALADSPPWSKTPSGGWRQAGDYRTSPEMVGVKRKMLRWGWDE